MKRSLAILISILAVLLITIFAVQAYKKFSPQSLNFIGTPPTPVIDQTANKKFSDQVINQSPFDFNKGITIERILTTALNGAPTPSPNYVSLLILNHTNEPIRFVNIGFNIQVFQYSLDKGNWTKVNLPFVPEKTPKVLPPKLEKLDFEALNTWELQADDFVNVTSNVIRIYISGIGTVSNLNYGASVDLSLAK